MLACLRAETEAELLVGARAVTFNPHFLHYSPSANDIALGDVDQWPPVPALLPLDSFEPAARSRLLQQVSNHPKEVWVLRQDLPSDPSAVDRKVMVQLGASLKQLPKKSLIQHSAVCWSKSSWDSSPARYGAQVWLLSSLSTVSGELLRQYALEG